MPEQVIIDSSLLIKMFILAFVAFVVSFSLTPIWTYLLYKWNIRKKIKMAKDTPVYSALHKKKANVPTMGGVLIWVTVLIITLSFNLSRSQTYLPLFALISIGILGMADDIVNVRGLGPANGLRARHKIIWLLVIALIGAWWFYFKLGWNIIHIPGIGDFTIGAWYIPLFVFVILATSNSVNITDGLDGLAGGLLSLCYMAYAGISFFQGNTGIAIFCATVGGAILAFLWFNIYPARFFMGDTGSLALGATLGVIAMLTNSVLILPIIGIVFVIETLSVIIQRSYKYVAGGKKIFLSTPIHHHFEALGWPETKVTMRFWVIGAVGSIIGLAIALIGRGIR